MSTESRVSIYRSRCGHAAADNQTHPEQSSSRSAPCVTVDDASGRQNSASNSKACAPADAAVVEASISVSARPTWVFCASVGQPVEEVLRFRSDVARWAIASAEVRSFFRGIEERIAPPNRCLHRIGQRTRSDRSSCETPQLGFWCPQCKKIKLLKHANAPQEGGAGPHRRIRRRDPHRSRRRTRFDEPHRSLE